MDIKKLIELLRFFNEDGAILQMRGKEGHPIFNDITDAIIPIKAENDGWWMAWRFAWYFEDSHPGHIAKIVQVKVGDSMDNDPDNSPWFEAYLEDSDGNQYHLEMLCDGVQEKDTLKARKKWLKYREANAERMAETDQTITQALTRVVEQRTKQ